MAEATKASEASEADARLLAGTFVLAEPRGAVQKQIEGAVDEAAGKVSFLIRPIVRSRLRAKNPVRERVRVEITGTTIAVRYDDARYEGVDGAWIDARNDDEPIRLRTEREGRTLRVSFKAEDGEKRMVHVVSEDGEKLSLEVTVESSKLPAPLVYRIAYRRQG